MPLPVPKLYRNKITIIIEDADLERGTITFTSRFDTMPNIERGPQTPAEQVAAMMMMFGMNYAVSDDNTPQSSILMPEDYVMTEGNPSSHGEMMAALIQAKLKQGQ